MLRKRLFATAVLALLAGSAGGAEPLGPGKYSGVVIFDRWGGCMLYRGVFVTYVSEAVKEHLREHAAQHVTVHATDVWQPVNPGGALIRRLKVVHTPLDQPGPDEPAGQLSVSAEARFEEGGPPVFVITVKNEGQGTALIDAGRLAPTLLGRRPDGDTELHRRLRRLHPADGPSCALISGYSLRYGGGETFVGQARYAWAVTEGQRLPLVTLMQPGDCVEISLLLTLPEGEYVFLAGYDSNPAVASGQISFDVGADGVPRLAGRRTGG